MQPYIAEVHLLGRIFTWRCIPNTKPYPPGHKRAGQFRRYAVPQSVIDAALAAEGLSPRFSRSLNSRNGFIRAVRKWLETHCDVSHAYSKRHVLDRLHEDEREMRFDINHITTNGYGTTMSFQHSITWNRAALTLTSTDVAVEAQINALLPAAKGNRNATDVRNLVRRIADATIAGGLMPWEGRSSYIVSVLSLPELDAICRFLGRIGVKTTLIDHLDPRPVPQQNVPQNGPPPPPPPPSNNGQVFADALADRILTLLRDATNDVGTMWSETDPKRRQRAEDAASESVHDALNFLHGHLEWLGTHRTILEDHAAAVEKRMRDRNAPPPAPPLPSDTSRTIYIPDPDDDISVIEVEVTDDETGEVLTPRDTFGSTGKIAWHMTPVTPLPESPETVEPFSPPLSKAYRSTSLFG